MSITAPLTDANHRWSNLYTIIEHRTVYESSADYVHAPCQSRLTSLRYLNNDLMHLL